MPTSNIDDLLMGIDDSTQVDSNGLDVYDEPQEMESDGIEYAEDVTDSSEDRRSESNTTPSDDSSEPEDTSEESESKYYDEYGNEKERMPKGMKERFDRRDKKHRMEIEQREMEIQELRAQLQSRGASSEVQKAAKDFEYNPDESGDWQQQLAKFVRQEVASMNRDAEESQVRQQEMRAQREFESKFRDGMSRFNDFSDVIEDLPFEITNPMTLATRAMEDPAAFLYAAAKRNPEELERISKIRDPYVQMTEMGRLEERMRKNKSVTSSPKPISRTVEDSNMKQNPKTGDSIEDLIAKSEAKKIAIRNSRVAGRR